MRLCSFIFATLAPALTSAFAAQAQPHVASQTITSGEIRGRVVDSLSGVAIASGSVSLRRAGDSSFAGAWSPDANGVFRLAGLAPGSYTILIRAIGYGQLLALYLTVSRNFGQAVKLRPKQSDADGPSLPGTP